MTTKFTKIAEVISLRRNERIGQSAGSIRQFKPLNHKSGNRRFEMDGFRVYQDFGFGLCATKCRIALSSMKNALAAYWNKICKRIYAMHANKKNPNWWVGEEAG